MPNRVLHESLLDSRSLEVLSPRAQDAFPRFILLADDFGCFEVNARILWAKGWSRRPDVSEADVAGWIAEYAERQAQDPETGKRLPPVLMLWTNAGRRYAFLTGWFGTHGQKKRAEYDPQAPANTPGRHGSKRKTPRPPAEILAAVMAGDVRPVDGKPPGTDREETGNLETEITNNSVPARETTGNAAGAGREVDVSREFPAPAVPVPVAVPVARETVATSPSVSPPPSDGAHDLPPERPSGIESPGPEDAPAESDAAQANAATPGGSAPAARDRGDAGPAGIVGKSGAPGPARPPDLSPVLLVLPCAGTGPREFGVTEAQAAKWRQAFPGVDTVAELRKALVWLEANPARVKTHRGMPAFCVRWLGKAQDDQRGGARAAAPARRPGMAAMGSAESFAKDEKPW
jgi:hypothetical protein